MDEATQRGLNGPTAGGEDPRWALVRRIEASESFRRSQRLRHLLTYLCDRAFSGRGADLSEGTIGVDLFGKAPGYDTANENVVRVTVRQLRLKLQEYFSSEGKYEAEILLIPKGSYVPEVAPRESGEAVPTPAPPAAAAPKVSRFWQWLSVLLGVAAAAATGAAILTWNEARYLRLSSPAARSDRNVIRATVLAPQQRTFLIPGDPVLEQLATGAGGPISLEEYLNMKPPDLASRAGLIAADQAGLAGVLSSRPMATADVLAAAAVLRVNPEDAGLIAVQHPSEVRRSEFRTVNQILIGNPQSNPWMTAVLPEFNFQPFFDQVKKALAIRNMEPRVGEPAQYSQTDNAAGSVGFGAILFRRSPDQNTSILCLAATSPAGLTAAAEFACHPEAADRLSAILDIDDLRVATHFELVLRVDLTQGILRQTEVVASRATLKARL